MAIPTARSLGPSIQRSLVLRSLILSLSLACLAFSGPLSRGPRSSPRQSNPDLTVHEWGTFTSIADRTGQAVRWSPLTGSTNLPDFVEHFHSAELKASLRGTIRMETPVLYFYSPNETTVSVKVRFSGGLISEWYPHASHIEPDPKAAFAGDDLFTKHLGDGSIAWASVTIAPGLTGSFPRDDHPNHYYTARDTSAAPLLVNTSKGVQQEKFLFYRGVSIFPIPIAARSLPSGRVELSNLVQDEIPSVILFERRGDKLGYRLAGPLQSGAVQDELQLDPPELTANIESLSHDLEGVLTSQGLYPDEARAMVKTWRSSWFEEGSRVFYIMPRSFVDAVLPLSITPSPSQTVRTFVGRLELITPATEQAVKTALAARDVRTITKYARFMEPIMDELKAENPAQAKELERQLSDTYAIPPSAR
jgi:hypothetical protein